jgi:ribosomal protein L37E
MTFHEPQLGPAVYGPSEPTDVRLHYSCDRCGAAMIELQCKIICTNCGHRFDCSDLNIYFD